jgi:hypothetical protein
MSADFEREYAEHLFNNVTHAQKSDGWFNRAFFLNDGFSRMPPNRAHFNSLKAYLDQVQWYQPYLSMQTPSLHLPPLSKSESDWSAPVLTAAYKEYDLRSARYVALVYGLFKSPFFQRLNGHCSPKYELQKRGNTTPRFALMVLC